MTADEPGWVASQILVISDLARSRAFWVGLLGAELVREYGGTTAVLRFAEAWWLLTTGAGPTQDKPTVTLRPPADPDTVSALMTFRVADCRAEYDRLLAAGAQFLTPPLDRGAEIRCFLQDPDGHLLELSQAV